MFGHYCFCNTIVPVMVGCAGCGIRVSVLPEAQYEYGVWSCPFDNVSRLLSVANMSFVPGFPEGTPIEPCPLSTSPWQSHPLLALGVQIVFCVKPAATREPDIPLHVLGGESEILRQGAASVKFTVPFVFVLSVYNPSVPPTHVPVT